jgi:hypothetical protein
MQALCGLAKRGEYAQIQGKAQLQADGSVKLASIGGKGEISFSKGEWDGVNQVLQAHQAGNLHDYRACVANTLPYFKSKVVTAKPKTAAPKKAVAVPKKTVAATKPAATSSTKNAAPEPDVEQSIETTGDITGDQNVTGNNAGGDMNINFGAKP